MPTKVKKTVKNKQAVKKINADISMATQSASIIPKNGFMREWQIVGNKKKQIQGVLPISRSSFLAKVRSGIYPAPVKLGVRITAWRVEDIRQLIEELGRVA